MTVSALVFFGVAARIATAQAATCQSSTATIVGTSSAETLQGTSGADVIASLGGNDTVLSGGGNDLVCAGDGDDIVLGEGGSDQLLGEAGDVDLLHGGAGNDVLNGGPGIADGASFQAGAAVTASLATGSATGQGSDSLSGIEGLAGSDYNDRLTGDGGAFNHFTGGSGSDVMNGGAGLDAVLFIGTSQPVQVDLAQGASSGEGNDVLTSIQVVSGTPLADRIFGDFLPNIVVAGDGDDTVRGAGGDDVLFGEAGDDALYGDGGLDELRGEAGNDSLDGGSGLHDLVVFASAPGGVNAALATGSATGEGSDSLARVEDLAGSAFSDTLKGNGASNRIAGLAGGDKLYGLGANDLLDGGDGIDTASGGSGEDYCIGETKTGCEVGASVSAPASLQANLPTNSRLEAPPGVVPPSASRGEGSSRSAADLVGGVRQALGGHTLTAAADAYEIQIWDINLDPPACFQGSRQLRMPVYAQAEGIQWDAYLYYWDAGTQEWTYTGASTGNIYPAAYYAGYFRFLDFWQYDTGAVVPDRLFWNAGQESDYYRWAEYALWPDGTFDFDWIQAHENVLASGGSYRDNWCHLPR